MATIALSVLDSKSTFQAQPLPTPTAHQKNRAYYAREMLSGKHEQL